MAKRTDLAHVRELRRFFQDARYDHEVIHELYRIGWHRLPDSRRDSAWLGRTGVPIIEQHRRVLLTLLEIGLAHADVLAWAFELRAHEPRLETLVGEYPGLAIRTDAARKAFERASMSGSHGSRRGIVGFICELPEKSQTLQAIRAETMDRVLAAMDAYRAQRGVRAA